MMEFIEIPLPLKTARENHVVYFMNCYRSNNTKTLSGFNVPRYGTLGTTKVVLQNLKKKGVVHYITDDTSGGSVVEMQLKLIAEINENIKWAKVDHAEIILWDLNKIQKIICKQIGELCKTNEQ